MNEVNENEADPPIHDVDDEETEQDCAGISSAPLKRYVTVVGDKKANKWTCNYKCKNVPYTGTYSRIRAHLIGLRPGEKAKGIQLCPKISKVERDKLKSEQEEASRVFTRKSAPPGLPVVPLVNVKGTKDKNRNVISDMFNLSSRNDVDGLVARFFYGCGISFNVARSPLFFDMVRGINEAPRSYKAPCSEKIRTVLLDKERAKIDCALICLKDQWPVSGVSIVSDGWSNIKNQPLINVVAISGGRAMFLNAIDCSGDEKSGSFIAELLLKAIESVGPYNVVQVLTDNASNCKRAGDIIMDRYPHIYWSGCMAHTLSLLMKDIAKSKNPTLKFVEETYKKAKGVVKYVKTHDMVGYIFRKFSALEVIKVKKTRFGHHYIVLQRMLRVKKALISMVLNEEWESIKRGTSKSKLVHLEVKKMNTPLHYLAYVLNPYYYSKKWLNSKDPMGRKRMKPHADPDIQKVYLDVVDRLVGNPTEARRVRHQLSDFVCNSGPFSTPQSIEDRSSMPAWKWWSFHGAAAQELASLAAKLLSQSVNSSCAERVWSIYNFVHSVRRNNLESRRAESLVYVHYNNRLLTRYRDDYELCFKNWDAHIEDDSMETDMHDIEEREHELLDNDAMNSLIAVFGEVSLDEPVLEPSRKRARVA